MSSVVSLSTRNSFFSRKLISLNIVVGSGKCVLQNHIFVVVKELGEYKIFCRCIFFPPYWHENRYEFLCTEPNPVRRSLNSTFKTALSAVVLKTVEKTAFVTNSGKHC